MPGGRLRDVTTQGGCSLVRQTGRAEQSIHISGLTPNLRAAHLATAHVYARTLGQGAQTSCPVQLCNLSIVSALHYCVLFATHARRICAYSTILRGHA